MNLRKLMCLSTILFFFSTVLAACSDNGDKKSDEPSGSLTLSTEILNFDSDGGSASVTVEASREWDASCDAAWVKISKSGTLDRSGRIDVTVQENTTTSPRNARLTILSGSVRANVSISQAAKTPEPVDPSIDVPEGYSLVWHDEFDGDALDSKHWRHEVKSAGWVNNELQNYVSSPIDGNPVTEVSDGSLKINCFKAKNGKIYSGRIYAHVNEGWKYGIMEARIKLPKGRGTWPAFWMMPVNNDFSTNPWPRCGEIDIMEEVGYHPNYTSSSIHCESYNHVIGTQKTAERYTAGAEDDFHVYRLEWTADYIRTYVDGNQLLYFPNDKANKVQTWPFDKPFYIILNLAWGGDWGGNQGTDESKLPATLQVDYVRVFQNNLVSPD